MIIDCILAVSIASFVEMLVRGMETRASREMDEGVAYIVGRAWSACAILCLMPAVVVQFFGVSQLRYYAMTAVGLGLFGIARWIRSANAREVRAGERTQ